MLANLKALWTTEPARVISITAAIVVIVLAKFGVVVDEQNVGETLALVLPILLGGEAIRAKVTPAPPARIGPPSDSGLPPEVVSKLRDTA